MKKAFLVIILTGFIGGFRSYAQDCILGYQTKMDQLLPIAAIQKHYKGDLSKAELKYRKSEPKYAKRDTYEYVWKSGRTRKMTVAGREMDVPDHNRIGLCWINEVDSKRYPDPVKYFKSFYRTATEAEKQQAAALIDKKLKEKGVSTAEQATGNAVGNTVLNTQGYETITGVGDAAAWDLTGSQLVVLKDRTTFKVISSVGTDVKANQELAKKLAGEILATCK
ncbi:hypothetical protein [Larkinella punicea]|uniref:Uncharacterized protein n=1 Tax=Larkinella punicea TaxID=2315727 RepID=A0A368JMS0_9BACT|nr:hypothetical protein [Larkinella punicea]RCR67954.1 hypothetical protein DUE52_19760 [Larkinella punicea]